MMGTRAAAFAGKISNLKESINRIQSGALPQPTGVDVSNMLRYFCQVLRDFKDFKDIQNIPLHARDKDKSKLASLPNFDYVGLYNAVVNLLDVMPIIQTDLEILGEQLLHLLACLVPFLEHSYMETIPYLLASALVSFPVSLHKELLDTLCYNLLPFTIDQQWHQMRNQLSNQRGPATTANKGVADLTKGIADNEGRSHASSEDLGFAEDFANLSVTGILMIVLHYMTEPVYHSQLVECLMKLKSGVFEDLLFVIAYGTTRARCPAVEILFRYWPDINPSPHDRKAIKSKHVNWTPSKCQNKNCNVTITDIEAVKMCLDFSISINMCDHPPPMLVCLDCAGRIQISQSKDLFQHPKRAQNLAANSDLLPSANKFIDLLLPMEQISDTCESKICKSSDKSAVGTCFDIECANYNCKKPIRYCRECLELHHTPSEMNNYDQTLRHHIIHSSINLKILNNEENAHNFVEAIISLLKEAIPADRPSRDSERYLRSLMGPTSQFNTDNRDMNIATEERQLISQYGIWLMTGLLKANVFSTHDKISDELLGRLLGMLFQWFHFTACLPDDQAGSALEKLKGECIKGWIMEVKAHRREAFISCLLPHPIDCSKIGGHWEVWPDTAHQIKEGFKRLLCLVPYDIITNDVWDEIMPYWMECFRHEVPENELSELKILLSKVFDPELSPLGFTTTQMYNFIRSRFEDTSNTNQEQTLYWLQILTMLEIPIPIDFLYSMLHSGVKSLSDLRQNEINRIAIASRLAETYRNNGMWADDPPIDDEEAERMRRCRYTGDTRSSERTSSDSSSSSMSPNSLNNTDDDTDGTSQKSQVFHGDGKSMDVRQQQQLSIAKPSSDKSPSASSKDIASATKNESAVTASARTAVGPEHGANKPTTDEQTGVKTRQSDKGTAKPSKLQTQPSPQQLPTVTTTAPPLDANSLAAYYENRVDDNLVCYILMIDILLKQLDLQEITPHNGLDGTEVQQAIKLLNTIISTPWLGHHTCSENVAGVAQDDTNLGPHGSSTSNSTSLATPKSTTAAPSRGQQQKTATKDSTSDIQTSSRERWARAYPHGYSHCVSGFEQEDANDSCVYCELISTFYQLAKSLIELFSPIIEVSICEVSPNVANGEFAGRPDYSLIGADHLGPSPTTHQEFDFSISSTTVVNSQASNRAQPIHDSLLSPYSPIYLGPSLRPEVLASLSSELQLTYNLLVQFHLYQTPDIVCQLLQMIKLISLHSQVLQRAAKSNPEFIVWCQHNMLMSRLWSLCQLESSEIARICVPLLMHCITLPWGVRLFRDLVEQDFNNDDWLSRFRAVERVVTIAYFCEPVPIRVSPLLQSSMANAFCYVVRCLDDIEATVAQRALVGLEMMKTSSLKSLLWSLEVQFDAIIVDRPMILQTVFQLYNHLKDRRFLTWEFFLNRFDTIFVEAQIYLQQTGEMPDASFMQDLKNTNIKSKNFQDKIVRAHGALRDTHMSRSLSYRLTEKLSLKRIDQQQSSAQDVQSESGARDILGSSGVGSRLSAVSNKTMSLTGTKLTRTSQTTSQAPYLATQSSARRKNLRLLSAISNVGPFVPDSKLHQHLPNSVIDDSLNELAQENHIFNVVYRVSDEDRDTSHSLIFLLMQFFSKPDPSHPQSLKSMNRNQQTLLRHLNILMGYSVARRTFLIPAPSLRLLPVFNAFVTSLPKVLDFNFSLGTILIDTCLPILIYAPAPEDTVYDGAQQQLPTYSLWLLNPLVRQSWLTSVMTFFYKYQFNQQPFRKYVHMLVQIVINTLESHLNCSLLDVSLDRCLMRVRDSNITTNNDPSIGAGNSQTAPDAVSTTQAAGGQIGGKAGVIFGSLPDASHSGSVVLDMSSGGLPSRQGKNPQSFIPDFGKKAAKYTIYGSSEKTSSLRRTLSPSPSPSQLNERANNDGDSDNIGRPDSSTRKKSSKDKPDGETEFAVPAGGISPSSSSPSLRARPITTSTIIQVPHHRALIKADTSDNLNLKNKALQPHVSRHSTRFQTQQSSGSMPTVTHSSAQSISSKTESRQVERLLPIGVDVKDLAQQRQSPKPNSAGGIDVPQVERLLPIGPIQSFTTALIDHSMSVSNLSGKGASATSELLMRITDARCHQDLSGRIPINGDARSPTPSSSFGSPSTLKQAIKSESNADSTKMVAHRDNQQALGPTRRDQIVQTPGENADIVNDTQVTPSLSSSPLMGRPGKDKWAQGRTNHFAAPSSTIGLQPLSIECPIGSPDVSNHEMASPSSETITSGKKLGAKVKAKLHASNDKDKDVNNNHNSRDDMNNGTSQTHNAGKWSSATPPPLQASFSSPSSLNEQLAMLNRQQSFVEEFSDKDLSLCMVILETFIHHEPAMAAPVLPNILRIVAKYATSNSYSWQSGSNVHLVGGSSSVARQFIRVALHDLTENNIFHQVFTLHFTDYEFYRSIATALADFSELNQLSPLCKLFEDLNRQKNLPPAPTLMTVLENVATYFECIVIDSVSGPAWPSFIANWENFLRKLLLALPRGSSGGPSSGAGLAIGANAPSSGPPGGGQASTGTGNTANSSGPSPSNQFMNTDSSANVPYGSQTWSGNTIMEPILKIMLQTTKVSALSAYKTIIDPYAKIISYNIQNSQFRYEHLLEINHNCCRLFSRDREKYLIPRTIAYELIRVMKFRFLIFEENLLLLTLYILQDVGGRLPPSVVEGVLKISKYMLDQADNYTTNVGECLRQYNCDLLEFITDVHAISRINSNLIGVSSQSGVPCINQDTFGGHIKAGISQYMAIELSLTNGNDNRATMRYMPWLFSSPSPQQGPREFIECVSHIRQLSWIILGSLQHSALCGHQAGHSGTGQISKSTLTCQPIPIEKNSNVAEHVQVILAGFAEQSKESVLHMSSLFHAFLLCQLWTMYCENMCAQSSPSSEQFQYCQTMLDDFWAKITPGVLQLVGHSRVMSEMVSAHFLQLIESLIESNSSVLVRYMAMWMSVFYSYKGQYKTGNLAMRLQKCIEWQPPPASRQDSIRSGNKLLSWLEKVQYKMSHIEIQSSQAAPFYCV
ncbi:Protein unc-79-like protein [Fragariocoptes setiger]|uniref:Protein unc-79-like protein n=1 Tax=Fragariocoptes setiger TaxID=1670756 RepID=A0ABQ7SBN3_9ACAR|nr:Protein unc-79-like protein [Fragariocoptes setiger]